MSIKSKQPIILELFSGSKTVSTFFESQSYNSFSIDNNQTLKPSICCNILDISKNMLPKFVDFIWASPDCRYFSRAGDSHHWKKETIKYRQYKYSPVTSESRSAIALINKTIEIINYFPDVPFVIENPIGRMHHTAALKSIGHNRYFVNYFNFGFSYSKETYLFSNLMFPLPIKKHRVIAPGLQTVNSRFQRSKIPPALLAYLFPYIHSAVKQQL